MLASAIVLGLTAGLLTGGRLRNLRQLRVRGLGLLAAAFVVRLIGLAVALPTFSYIAALACLATVAFLNRALPGAVLIGFGIIANLAVVAANGGMPVSADALAQADALMPRDGLHILLSDHTLLPFLGDVIPVALAKSVYSVGDFVLAIGGFRCTLGAVRAR